MLNQNSANKMSVSKSHINNSGDKHASKSSQQNRQADTIHTKPSGIKKIIGSMFIM